MKFNKWTLALAAAGVLSLGSVVQAEEAAKNQVITALTSTTLSGYVDTSAIWELGHRTSLPGRSYDGLAKQDGFNLDVVKLSLEKPLDEGQWSAGYKVDLLFGPDANTFATTSTGTASSDFAVKQAYVALRAPVGNGLDFKLGVWDTIIGYEVFDAGNNPNYSRSFGYFLEPTTYTGLQASYKVADWLSFTGGVADPGTSATINNRSAFAKSIMSYMGSVTLTAPDSMGVLKGAALYGGVIDHGKTGASADVLNFYTGATVPTPLTGLSVGAAYDYQGASHRGAFGPGFVPSFYANAVSLYASFQMDKWKFNNRLEYASGSNYAFGVASVPNHPVELLGETFTVDYSLWDNVITRVEFRWDHDLKGRDGGPGAFVNTHGGYYTPGEEFVVGGEKNALSIALNVIYKF